VITALHPSTFSPEFQHALIGSPRAAFGFEIEYKPARGNRLRVVFQTVQDFDRWHDLMLSRGFTHDQLKPIKRDANTPFVPRDSRLPTFEECVTDTLDVRPVRTHTEFTVKRPYDKARRIEIGKARSSQHLIALNNAARAESQNKILAALDTVKSVAEIANETKLCAQTVRARCKELIQTGAIRKLGRARYALGGAA
jgi:hypothetical protein